MLKSLHNRNTIDLIWQLFRTDFKLKYNDSILGFIWVLLKPFTIFLIMYFVLSKIFVSTEENFAIYLLIGNVFITLWSDGTNMGMDSLYSRAGLITKVNFPRYVVLLSATAISYVNFLINTVVVAFFMILQGVYPTPLQVFWYFFCSVILYLLILNISMIISVIYIRFRDLKQIWELFNQVVFWGTPVFYSVDVIASKSEAFRIVLTILNPISVLLTSARKGVLNNDISLQMNVFIWLCVICMTGFLSYLFYKKSIKKIAEYF